MHMLVGVYLFAYHFAAAIREKAKTSHTPFAVGSSDSHFYYQFAGMVYARKYPYNQGKNAKTLERSAKNPAA
jgi:hypothetical protein